MGYVTQFTPGGQRDLTKVPLPAATRILRRLTELQRALDGGDISAFDVKALQGYPSHWRLRVGDHRVVYTIEDGELIVWVVSVGHRREVYRRF
ncbi:type II toxin-antitoxin system RelE/ParE family toxin [Kitasatospora sp. NPDC051170]|uniref:type II toxin-antitoxin system RelE/ParE family toxin n=1 Tax=Kitasatospora sp. NPDC051170 TaxID=3364056 RepID=UPI0037B8AB0D